MNKILFSTIIGLAMLSTSAHSVVITSSTNASLMGATIETFDSVATGYYNSLSLTGVTVVGNGAAMFVDSSYTGLYGIGGQTLNNSSGYPESFDLIFDNEISAFGIWGGAYNNDWTFTAFDSLNNIIEAATIATSCCEAQFNGLANSNMKRITLSGYGDWVIFDNLAFTSQVGTVPEPSILALLSLGLLAVGFSRKKKV